MTGKLKLVTSRIAKAVKRFVASYARQKRYEQRLDVAKLAMQAQLTNTTIEWTADNLARYSLDFADALMQQHYARAKDSEDGVKELEDQGDDE